MLISPKLSLSQKKVNNPIFEIKLISNEEDKRINIESFIEQNHKEEFSSRELESIPENNFFENEEFNRSMD